MEKVALSGTRRSWAKPEHIEFADIMINHYKEMELLKDEMIKSDKENKVRIKKCHRRKMMFKNIVTISIKKGSLKLCDKGMLKIRSWPRRDEFGNKLYDDRNIVVKVERYDILAFVRILSAAKVMGDDIFENFLSIYDVRKIIDNIQEDYFGDLRLFLSRETI